VAQLLLEGDPQKHVVGFAHAVAAPTSTFVMSKFLTRLRGSSKDRLTQHTSATHSPSLQNYDTHDQRSNRHGHSITCVLSFSQSQATDVL
jgi:hypothetical protein